MTEKEFFLRHSYAFRNFIARHYPLKNEIIIRFKDLFSDYQLKRNPNIDKAYLKSINLEFWDSSFLDKPFEPTNVSEFLNQGSSQIPFLDSNLMSNDLNAKTLENLLDKGYEFQYLALEAHHLNWTFELFEIIYTYLGGDYNSQKAFSYEFYDSTLIYKTLYEPFINDEIIIEVLTEKYDDELNTKNIRYFGFEQDDIKNYVNISLNYEDIPKIFHGLDFNSLGNWIDKKPEANQRFKGIISNSYSTKPVQADFVKLNNTPWGVIFFVSERIKEVLCQFKLPPHCFTPIECEWDTRTKKKYKLEQQFIYYAFIMDSKVFFKNLDFTASEFAIIKDNCDNYGYINDLIIDKKIKFKNYDEYISFYTTYKKSLKIICTKFVSNLDWDFIGFEYSFMFNEDVRKAIEKLKPIGLKFNPYEEYYKRKAINIHLLGAETKEHRKNNLEIINKLNNNSQYISKKIEEISTILENKVKYLENQPHLVEEYYNNKNDNQSISEIEAKIREKEIELNVVFPPKFRLKLLNNRIPKKMRKYYTSFQIEKFISIGSGSGGWQEYSPEAINAVAVADNGCGDYLGFILKENHDFFLDDTLILFDHETATLEEI